MCTGDWLGGLSIDVLEYSEIGSLTESKEALERYLYFMMGNVTTALSKTGELDEVPGQSTEFFSFMTDDEERLKTQLRNIINGLFKTQES